MKFKGFQQSIWPVSLFGLGLLLLIIGLCGAASLEQSTHIYRQILAVEENYRNMENLLEAVRLETFRIAILGREGKPGGNAAAAGEYGRQFTAYRAAVEKRMQRLRALRPPTGDGALDRLRAALDAFFTVVGAEFSGRAVRSAEVLEALTSAQSHRLKIFEITDEISRLNAANYESRRRAMDRAIEDLRQDLWSTLITALFVGVIIAAGSVFRISDLEKDAARQQRATARAEKQLRHLSQQLVSSQEQERKFLSRELHDEIGQSLTALRIELGNLERTRVGGGEQFSVHLAETKRLAEDTLKSARDIAMGLRPAMLDELGLEPALQWQAREFSRRCSSAVTLDIQGGMPELPDPHRTYLYRIVQEALTNCARHARAKQVWVRLQEAPDGISLSIEDDGAGFNVKGAAGGGLGLLGIAERVRELRGSIVVDSSPGAGTRLRIVLPYPAVTPALLDDALTHRV